MQEQPVAVKSEAVDPKQAERLRGGRVYRPSVDILETSDDYILQADLPGAKGDLIDVRYEDGELTLRAPIEAREVPGRPLLAEYGVGDFHRAFRLSEQIDASRITAEYARGVLTLRLPKTEAVRPRKIAVTAG